MKLSLDFTAAIWRTQLEFREALITSAGVS